MTAHPDMCPYCRAPISAAQRVRIDEVGAVTGQLKPRLLARLDRDRQLLDLRALGWVVVDSRARRLWVPWSGPTWPPPRLLQLRAIVVCRFRGHTWCRWRIETEEWYEEGDVPIPWAWRCCRRCRALQNVVPERKR